MQLYSRKFIQWLKTTMNDIRYAHMLDTPIVGLKVGVAKAAPTAPCAPGLSSGGRWKREVGLSLMHVP